MFNQLESIILIIAAITVIIAIVWYRHVPKKVKKPANYKATLVAIGTIATILFFSGCNQGTSYCKKQGYEYILIAHSNWALDNECATGKTDISGKLYHTGRNAVEVKYYDIYKIK